MYHLQPENLTFSQPSLAITSHRHLQGTESGHLFGIEGVDGIKAGSWNFVEIGWA